MKQKLLFLFAVIICCTQSINAQTETWTKKKSLGYDIPSRYEHAMTALNDKLYFLGGYDQSPYLSNSVNDFWEYNPSTKTYRRLKDPEGGNWRTSLYAVQGKLFYLADEFYEYDFIKNEWLHKASYPGNNTLNSAGFVIGNTIYVAEASAKNFFAYNIATNKWTKKTNTPISGGPDNVRYGAVGFSLNGYGYFGSGTFFQSPGINDLLSDFYKYDPVNNTWSSIASLPEGLLNAVAATADGKAYVGTGAGKVIDDFYSTQDVGPKNVWYEYSDVTNTWIVKAPCPGNIHGAGVASVSSDIFIFGGKGIDVFHVTTSNNMFRYNAATNTWAIDTLNAGANRADGMSFIMNNKLYTGGGAEGQARSDWWEYDIPTELWARKADIPGIYTYADRSVTVNANGKAYAIGGWYPYYDENKGASTMAPKNLLEYDPSSNKWTTKAAIPGDPRYMAAIFSIGNYVYAGLGVDSNGWAKNDFYKYNIATNKWATVKNCPVTGHSGGHFSLNGKGYVLVQGTYSENGNYLHLFYEYDPATNKWTKKSIGIDNDALPIENVFAVNNKIYFLVTDWLFYNQTKVVEYDPATGESRALTNAPLNIIKHAVATDGSNAYLFGGIIFDPENNLSWRISNQLWKFTPKAVVVDTIAGDLQGIKPDPVPLKNTAANKNATLYDSSGAILAALSSNGDGSLSVTSWSGRIMDRTATHRERFGWFGNNAKEPGMYFNKNILAEGGNADTTTMRIYCTPLEINNFIAAFNTKYGTAYTQNDIRVLSYSYTNDLDPLNNLNGNADSVYYKKTIPQIKNYGSNNEYRYFEFTSPATYGEYYLVLSVPCNLNPKITASGSTTNVCPGASLILTASAGFAKYKWNTGATTQQITVTAAGPYFVTVTDAAGCSKKTATTNVTYQVCAAPSGLAYSNVSSTGAKLSWNKVGCGTGYEVQYKINGTSAWSTINVSADTSLTLTGLTPAKKYLWRMRTKCNSTFSAYVNGTSFTTSASLIALISKDDAAIANSNWTVSLSPNPAKANTVLSINGKLKNFSVVITDIVGKQVWKTQSVQAAQLSLPVDNLQPGIYLVTVNDGQNSKIAKLVKE